MQIRASDLDPEFKVLQLVTQLDFPITQINGQRRLGPPPDWIGPAPGLNCEIFVGRIPRNIYEHEIYPIFRKVGKIYEVRLMMDFTGTNRGYCFIMYTKPEYAMRATKELDQYEFISGEKIGVVPSVNNCRLRIWRLPSNIQTEIVVKRIFGLTDDVDKVAVYKCSDESADFALISFKTHRSAAMGKRRLMHKGVTIFEGAVVNVGWVHPTFNPWNVLQIKLEEIGMYDKYGGVKIIRTIMPEICRCCLQLFNTAYKSNRPRKFAGNNGMQQPDVVPNKCIPFKKNHFRHQDASNRQIAFSCSAKTKKIHQIQRDVNDNLRTVGNLQPSKNYITYPSPVAHSTLLHDSQIDQRSGIADSITNINDLYALTDLSLQPRHPKERLNCNYGSPQRRERFYNNQKFDDEKKYVVAENTPGPYLMPIGDRTGTVAHHNGETPLVSRYPYPPPTDHYSSFKENADYPIKFSDDLFSKDMSESLKFSQKLPPSYSQAGLLPFNNNPERAYVNNAQYQFPWSNQESRGINRTEHSSFGLQDLSKLIEHPENNLIAHNQWDILLEQNLSEISSVRAAPIL